MIDVLAAASALHNEQKVAQQMLVTLYTTTRKQLRK